MALVSATAAPVMPAKIMLITIFMEAAREAADIERKIIRDQEQEQLKELKTRGMDIRSIDTELFIDAMKSVYTTFLNKYPTWEAVENKIRAISG